MAKKGLIPKAFIDQVIEKTDIVDVIGKRLELRHKGKNFLGLCPFHHEKSPSFTVSEDKQLFYCFGCGAGGNVINFIMDYDRLDFVEAIEQLAFLQGLEIPKNLVQDPEDFQKTEHLYSILAQVTQYYRRQLKDHPMGKTAVAYLKQRKLTGEIAKMYGLGLAPPGWDNLTRQFSAPDKQKWLLQTGMLIQKDNGTSVDRFRHRIMFPIRDMRGRVIGFGGRVLNPEEQPKYLNSPETLIFHKSKTLYGLYEARQHKSARLERLLVVEGYMDVVSLAQHGIWETVATLGTAVSSDQVKQMMRLVNEIIFCFDGDLAGRKAAERALDISLPQAADQLSIRFLFLPQGEDPDSLIQKEGKAEFEKRITTASTLSEFLLKILSENINFDSIEDRAKVISKAIPWLEKLPSQGVLRNLIIQKLAKMTHVSESAILLQMSNSPSTTESVQLPQTTHKKQNSKVGIHLVHDLLKMLVNKPQLALEIKDIELLKHLNLDAVPLLVEVVDAIQNDPDLTVAKLIAKWQGSELITLLSPYLHAELLLTPEQLLQQFHDTVERLFTFAKEQELDRLLNKAKMIGLTQIEKQHMQQLLSGKTTLN